jgi:hypothetical protein
MSRKLIYILLFISILGIGCVNEQVHDTTFISNQILVNKTNLNLLYIINTNSGNDTIVSKGYDSTVVSFKKYATLSLPLVGPYSINVKRVEIIEKKIFNFTDTTSYFRIYGTNEMNKLDSIFFSQIEFLGSGDAYNIIETEKLIVSEKLFPIMKKDYSMLDRFKQYYNR